MYGWYQEKQDIYQINANLRGRMLKEEPLSISSKTIAFHNFPHNDTGQTCSLPVYLYF